MSNSFSPLAFLTELREVLKKTLVLTPGISNGYWNAKNIPFWALSSVDNSLRFWLSNIISPFVS